MKNTKRYLRFLWMTIPLLPAFPLLRLRGYRFSGILCLCLSLLIGIFCAFSLWNGKKSRIFRNIFLGLLAVLLIFSGITEIYILSNSAGTSEICPYIIVLGAGLRGTEPSLILQNRLDAAAVYLKCHPETICVVSGGKGHDEVISEASCMQRELLADGIAPERILLEEESANTAQNLRYSLKIIEKHQGFPPEKVGIVSNEFHLARAKFMAQTMDISPVGIPAETTLPFLKINYFVREIPALWKYLILGG